MAEPMLTSQLCEVGPMKESKRSSRRAQGGSAHTHDLNKPDNFGISNSNCLGSVMME